MVNPIAFHSRSADLAYATRKKKTPNKMPEPVMLKSRKPLAMFIGNPEQEFMKFGSGLGFSCIAYDKSSDPSHIVQAKVVIAQHMQYDFPKWIELINMSVSYGIPTVWVHPILPPGRWMWSFRYCFVGVDIKPVDLWRKICQKVM